MSGDVPPGKKRNSGSGDSALAVDEPPASAGSRAPAPAIPRKRQMILLVGQDYAARFRDD